MRSRWRVLGDDDVCFEFLEWPRSIMWSVRITEQVKLESGARSGVRLFSTIWRLKMYFSIGSSSFHLRCTSKVFFFHPFLFKFIIPCLIANIQYTFCNRLFRLFPRLDGLCCKNIEWNRFVTMLWCNSRAFIWARLNGSELLLLSFQSNTSLSFWHNILDSFAFTNHRRSEALNVNTY